MTIGSLFSGIGGLELGLEWAGLGPVMWQVEIDPKCRNCLAKHWPDAERFEDVCKVGSAELKPVDIICGGFPCQDVSSAGKRAGLSGARSGLWSEMARVIGELRPRWVVIENVASGGRKWVDAIRIELDRLGYGSLPIPLSAADCGAWHERARIFVVAYTRGEHEYEPLYKEQSVNIGGEARQVFERGGETAAHTDPQQLRQRLRRSERPNGLRQAFAKQHCGWETEPNLARVVPGFPGRVDRERALGNSVVPQCAEVIGNIIKDLAA